MRFRIGIVFTIGWLAVTLWVALRSPVLASAMKPNEWGDFFAGFFAPLAFLWLVLGYIQQGEELKRSTDALRLQAEELRHSVENQRDLVSLTRQQAATDEAALQEEAAARIAAGRPRFAVMNHRCVASEDGSRIYALTFANAGAAARRAVARLHGLGHVRTVFELALFSAQMEHQAEIKLECQLDQNGALLSIRYLDMHGEQGLVLYRVVQSPKTQEALDLVELQA